MPTELEVRFQLGLSLPNGPRELCEVVEQPPSPNSTSSRHITAVKWEPGQSWVGRNGCTSGGRFTSRRRRRQDGFSRRVPVQTSSGGSGRRCTLVLMSMAGWYHDCLGQSGIRRRAGALDIRSFLTTAAMSSTGGQSSRVSSRDQCVANSLWHWRRRKMECSSSGWRGDRVEGRHHPIHDGALQRLSTARSPVEKPRARASANLFTTDGIHYDEIWSPTSSSTIFKSRSSLIMGWLDATNAFVTCTTLELSTQSLNKDIPYFFTRSQSVPMSTIRIALSSLTEMHSALFYHSHIPWSCHCSGSTGFRSTSSIPPKPTSAASVCIIPLVRRGQIGTICLCARQFPPRLQVPYRLMTQPTEILIP
jgi:hypothetical protein